MTVDRYTKAVLTVIAVCLVWLSLGGPSLLPTVNAQNPNVVYLGGWVDALGATRPFPNPPPVYGKPEPGKRIQPAPFPVLEDR